MSTEPQKQNQQQMQLLTLPVNVDGFPLTIQEKEIATACQQVKIKELTPQEFGLFMTGLIGRTFLNCGQDMGKDDNIDRTIDELCADLQKYNGTLSCPEIEIAFKNGFQNKYGKYFGLNNKTFFGWVNAYTWSQSRLNAKKALELAKNKEAVKKEIPAEEKERIVNEGAIGCFEHYKKNQIIYDMGNVTYDYLDKKGIIPFTDEVKKEIYKTCKAKMIDEQKMKLTDPANIGKHQGIKSAIKEIEENRYSPVVAESKRMALKKYFDQLIQMEINLQDEL